MEFRDQVLERIFRKWENIKAEDSEESSSDDSNDGLKMELRDRYLL
jgi:hypothetical protein